MVTTGTSVITGIVVFVAAPIAANRLGPDGRGTLVTVQLLPQILGSLASVGLGFSIIHFGSPERRSVRVLWRWSLRRCALGSAVVWSVGQLLAPVITSSGSDERMLRVYLFLCPLQAFTDVPYELLRALGFYRVWNAFTFAIKVVWPVALVIGVLQPVPSLWLVVWLHLGATLLILMLIILTTLRLSAGRSEPPEAERSEFLLYGVKSALSTIPSSANAKMDQLVMAALVTKNDLGLYAAATGWSQITLPVMRGLIAVSMPFVSGSDDGNRLARVTRLMTLGVIAVVVLGVGGILATLLLWGPLYGPEYASALPAAVILVVASLLLQYNGLLGNILRSLNRPGLVTWIEAGVLFFSTIALIGALQIQPVMGAAMVSLLTYTIAALVYGKQISKRLQIDTRRLFDFAGGMGMLHQIRQRVRR